MKDIAKDKFYKNIKEAGLLYDGDEPLFYNLVVSEIELNELLGVYGSYESISEHYKVDFISVHMKSEIDFIHLTDVRNQSGIEKLGLLVPNSEYIPDLGKGVYVVDVYSEKGFDNVKDYIAEKDNMEELLVIEGSYEGELEICVYGDGHEGYIVINNYIDPENLDMRVMSVDDFLFADISEFQY